MNIKNRWCPGDLKMIRWCGCKGVCSEEDTGRAKPVLDGLCEMRAENGPRQLAEHLVFMLTPDHEELIRNSGVTTEIADLVEQEDWSSEDVDRTLDLVERMCGYKRGRS